MARRKIPLHAPRQDPKGTPNPSSSPKGKVSARDYYNKRYKKVDKKHRSILGLYVDTTNSYIDRIERGFVERESVV